MVQYRRARVPGGTYFFTVALRDRKSAVLVEHIDALRQTLRDVLTRRPFAIDAMVILPDHVHAVWTLPEKDADYSVRWRLIKAGFIRALRAQGMPLTANAKGEYDLWQRRFWEHQIRDEFDRATHVDYVHINPLKHGLAKRVIDWPWSTFHRYVREKKLPADWASATDAPGKFGE